MQEDLPVITCSVEKVSARALYKHLGYKGQFSKWLLDCLLFRQIPYVGKDDIVFDVEGNFKDLALELSVAENIIQHTTLARAQAASYVPPKVAYNPNTGECNV